MKHKGGRKGTGKVPRGFFEGCDDRSFSERFRRLRVHFFFYKNIDYMSFAKN